ncbi:lysozyme [uncultured Hymenobacter sp.]|uniref:lysozyme n=1 Tax=uncultured Hymenobacter sp. TaxID=170016 RepID=UPI0035CA2214
MKTGARGLALIKKKELFMAKAYYCPAHILTIGYGHVIAANEPHLKQAVLTEAEASALLCRDVLRYEKAVLRGTEGAKLTQNQFDACVCLCYNIGEAGFEKSSVARLISARAGEAAIRGAWSLWNKMDGTRNRRDDDKDGLIDEPGEKQVAAGLVTRRKEEADLFFLK